MLIASDSVTPTDNPGCLFLVFVLVVLLSRDILIIELGDTELHVFTHMRLESPIFLLRFHEYEV
jgi:hypothetical protein